MAQHPTNKPTILYQPLLAQVLWLSSTRGKKLAVYHATHKQTNKHISYFWDTNTKMNLWSWQPHDPHDLSSRWSWRLRPCKHFTFHHYMSIKHVLKKRLELLARWSLLKQLLFEKVQIRLVQTELHTMSWGDWGGVAQMVERSLCMREVAGSMPAVSNFSRFLSSLSLFSSQWDLIITIQN